MAFQPVLDTAEALVIFTVNAQRCTMTFHYSKLGGYDQAAIDALADDVNLWALAQIVPLLSIAVIYNGVEVRGLESVVDLFASAPATQTGGNAAQPLPNHDTFAVKRVTGMTGRAARGRVYFPLVQTALAADENFIIPSFADSIQAALNLAITAASADGWTHVLVSRQQNGIVPAFGVTRVITGYERVDLEVDTQRRRMPSK